MLSIILSIIGLLALIISIGLDINLYNKGEYNPSIFKNGGGYGYGYNFRGTLTVCLLVPMFFITPIAYKMSYISVGTIFVGISTTVLNILSYQHLRSKRIIIETVIFDIVMLYIVIVSLNSILGGFAYPPEKVD